MSEETPRFSVTFRDNEQDVTLAVQYDKEIHFRRGVVVLSNAIARDGLRGLVAAGQQYLKDHSRKDS